MPPLNIRRIRRDNPDAAAQLAALRARLGATGDVVSPRGRAMTMKVFGEALSATRVVERICADVQKRGADALFHYTEQFDGVQLTA